MRFILIFILSTSFLTKANSLSIEGFEKKDDDVYQFSKLLIGDAGGEYFLNIKSSIKENVRLTLVTSDKETLLSDFTIQPGIDYRFPGENKVIELNKAGNYTFSLSDTKGDNVDELTIIINETNQKTLINPQSLKENSKKELNLNFEFEEDNSF